MCPAVFRRALAPLSIKKARASISFLCGSPGLLGRGKDEDLKSWLQPWWRRVKRGIRISRRIRKALLGFHQKSLYGILANVDAMMFVVVFVADAMVREACFPDRSLKIEFLLGSEGEPAFYVLNCLLEGNFFSAREKEMEMFGHDNKLMQEEFVLASIILQNLNQQISHAL